MRYYFTENGIFGEKKKTAWSKAREDINNILKSSDFDELLLDTSKISSNGMLSKFGRHWNIKNTINKLFNTIKKDDIVVIQLPLINNTIFFANCLKHIKHRGAKIISVIHDLETLRIALLDDVSYITKVRTRIEERSVLKISDSIIVHNKIMKQFLVEQGYPESKLVVLGLFDYLQDERAKAFIESREPDADYNSIIIAGNLSPEKSGYIYNVPSNISVNLYGIGYVDNQSQNLKYYGSFQPGDLPTKMHGGFGLVWDGDSSDTCSGVYGKYLRFNNPHKTSLYLSSGFPVIIWKEAALASFIVDNDLGFAVDSLDEIPNVFEQLTKEQYLFFYNNVRMIKHQLQEGAFFKNAIKISFDHVK